MTRLNTAPNIGAPDEVSQWLIDMHAGRGEADSHKINARLILLLVNHIGDLEVVKTAIEIAAASTPRTGPGP